MSKPLTSRLTASGPSRPALVLPTARRDELDRRLGQLEVLANLMSASRHEHLLPGVVEEAGLWIGTELREIRALLR
jgi:hypothetical protein